MNERLLELASRQGMLKARIEAQRQMLGQHALPLESAFAVADKAVAGVDWVKKFGFPLAWRLPSWLFSSQVVPGAGPSGAFLSGAAGKR